MGFTRRLKYYLVHMHKYTNKQAGELIAAGKIKLNGIAVTTNCLINETDKIELNGLVLKEEIKYVYIKFNKPRGFESTLNKNIKDNISHFLPEIEGLAIAGRLDKNSEGLLLISNDGKWVEMLCNPLSEKEKIYEVELENEADDEFVKRFSEGVDIGFYVTKPCFCEKTDSKRLKVILTEGKNKQIRRMCKTLKNKVIGLKRTAIENFDLGDLELGMHELTKI